MLGNWSFGDYFKKEAIQWAWEFLTEVCKLDADRLYITYFEGDVDQLGPDNEAKEIWGAYVGEDRILPFDRKDNFWEWATSDLVVPVARYILIYALAKKEGC